MQASAWDVPLAFVVRETVLRSDQAFIAFDSTVDPREIGEALLDGLGEPRYKLGDVGDDTDHPLLIELNGLGYVVEDPDVVDDQPMRLLLAVWAIGSADGLEQRVIPERLVQIHRLENRGVEPGEEL